MTKVSKGRRLAIAALFAFTSAAPGLAAAAPVKVPEGRLSSGKNTEGDKFSISLDDQVKLPDGTIIPAGYSGRGEVTDAKKKGMMGQAGELNVRLDYIRVGEGRIRLRASKGGEGKGAMGATIALTVLFGPLGLLKHGHDIEIKPGQTITAYVDQDAEIETPLPPPPVDN